MIGITSYGAYIPYYRLKRDIIFAAMGWFNSGNASVSRGEKAVTNHDEDTLTMAVSAAIDCLNGREGNAIGGLYLGSTTAPYLERLNSAICAAALSLKPDVRTADFNACLRAGTSALISACEAVNMNSVDNLLVCASDSRQGKPGSHFEYTFGDGAAALMVGRENVVAEFKGCYSLSHDFIDYRRLQEDRFVRGWEERWIKDEGYAKIIPQAVSGLLKKYQLKIDDFASVVISCPDSKSLSKIGKGIGINPEKLQDNLMSNVGDTGAALPLMMLVSALEKASAGDKIMVVSYGSGSDALFFEVTEEIDKLKSGLGIKGHLNLKEDLDNYSKYLVYRDILPMEIGIRGEEMPPLRLSVMNREGQTMAALQGCRCKACGTPQFPKQRTCINPECGVIDQMEEYSFHDKIGRIKSFTGDNLAYSISPPAIYGLIDFDEGGRLYLDITDCDLADLKVGSKMKMSFRRRYADKKRSVFAYFWKAVPIKNVNLEG